VKAVYRYAWLKNQVLAERTVALLDAFAAAGIATMLLKGAALLPYYDDDFGRRPMDDFDVLVPADRASEAIDVLVSAGLRPSFRTPPEQVKELYLHRASGWGFDDGRGLEIDLHWHMLYASVTLRADDDFWSAARATEFRRRPTLVPHPSDLLLNVCAHGSYWNPVPPIRWVADAMMLLRRLGSSFDWDRLVSQTVKHRIRPAIRDCLRYLREHFEAPVPAEVLRALRPSRTPLFERVEYRALTVAPTERTSAQRAAHDYGRYLRRTFPPGRRIGPSVPIEYLRQLWQLPHAWQVPVQAAYSALGRPAKLRPVVAPLLRRGADLAREAPRYRLGDELTFAAGGNARPYESLGWSRPEETGTWTTAREARVRLPLKSPPTAPSGFGSAACSGLAIAVPPVRRCERENQAFRRGAASPRPSEGSSDRPGRTFCSSPGRRAVPQARASPPRTSFLMRWMWPRPRPFTSQPSSK